MIALSRSIALVALGVPALLFGQKPDKTVHYTARALPMRVVVEELGRQGGIKLRVDAEMEDEPLILRLNDVPLKTAMDKLADVFAAEWVDHGSYFRLERSSQQIDAFRKRVLRERADAIRDSIQALAKLERDNPSLDGKAAEELVKDFVKLEPLFKDNPGPEVARRRFLLNSRTPTTRLGVAVLNAFDPEELASLPVGSTTTYSSEPTGLQRKLPAVDSEVIERFVAERKAVADAYLKTAPDPDTFSIPTLAREARSFDRPPTKLLVSATSLNDERQVFLEISLLDSKGQSIAEDAEIVGVDYQSSLLVRPRLNAAMVEAARTGFELDTVGKELAPRTGNYRPEELRPLSKETLEALLHPTKRDPLGIATCQILLTEAERQGLNVVCLAPDSVEAYALSSARTGKTSLQAFLASIEGSQPVTFARSDGWLIGRPRNPLRTAETRLSRSTMEAFLQRVAKEGRVTLEAASQLRASVARDCSVEWALRCTSWLLPNEDVSVMFGNVDLMRLYGSLTDEQREIAAKSGLSIRYGDLSVEQQESLRNYVADSRAGPLAGSKTALRSDSAQSERGGADLRPDTEIQVREATELRAFKTFEVGGRTIESQTPLSEVAWTAVPVDHPEFADVRSIQGLHGFKLGTQRLVSIKVLLGNGGEINGALSENHKPAGAPLPLDRFLASLPADVLKSIREEEERIVRQLSASSEEEAPPSPVTKPPRRA